MPLVNTLQTLSDGSETKTPSGFPWFLSGCSLTLHKPHRRASASQDGNLCLHRQQSWTFAGTVGPPGSDEFNVCAQQQIITLAAHTDWARQQLESKDNEQLHSTTELHQAKTQSSSLVYAKQNTHTLKFILVSFRLKPSYFILQHTGPEQSREEGMDHWVGHAAEWEQQQALQYILFWVSSKKGFFEADWSSHN